jgi:hypothetical protein
MSKAVFKTIGELFDTEKKFVIPNYQRGYKWAVKDDKGNLSHLEKLLNDLWEAYTRSDSEYFLQGITIYEDGDNLSIIDGQQRITSIYLIKWTLCGKDYIAYDNLIYNVGTARQESGKFLSNLKEKSYEEAPSLFNHVNGEEQDIYYFKEAIAQILDFKEEKQQEKNQEDQIICNFLHYIQERVRVIYITIDDAKKAVRTFTMMNGSKASMLPEELIKAEMLRKISLPLKNTKEVSFSMDDGIELLKTIIAKDWETSTLRSKYAREWDKWLYWWNRKDVQSFFSTSNPMGLLLDYYFRLKNKDKYIKFSYESFNDTLLNDKENKVTRTKSTFKGLRDLQKKFEDLFNDPISYNWLGLSLQCDSNEKFEIIQFFLSQQSHEDMEYYAKRKIVGCTNRQILDSKKEINEDNKVNEDNKEYIQKLNGLNQVLDVFTYRNNRDICFKLLYYLNILEDNKLHRKFDFEICKYGNPTLEHIYAKSMVFHIDTDDAGNVKYYRNDGSGEDEECSPETIEEIKEDQKNPDKSLRLWINRKDIEDYGEKLCGIRITEHSIGNLVLLYQKDNSKFGNKTFFEKKEVFFDVKTELPSRHLLHTISKFAGKDWRQEQIVLYYSQIKDLVKNFYNEK